MTAERTCVVEKGPNGYGFHLHSEKSRTGQFVRLVEPGSAAEKSGLRAGDRLIRVCGEDVRELTHQQVVSKIRAATEKLVLEVEGSEEMSQEKPQVVEEPTESVAERSERRPRLCTMKKSSGGYGFNLHSDKNHPGQYVRAVDPDSPAERSGLLPKDRILEVNGESMLGKQHADVVSAIKTGGDETTLLVVDPETDKYFQECHVTPGREHLTGPLPEKVANGSIEKEEISDAPLETDAPSDSPVSSPELLPIDMSPQESQKDISDSGPVPNTDPVPDAATLDLNMSLAVAKERAHQKRSQKKAPTMDWSKRKEVFSSL
ncbi:Na(+)/H(+) exchange regulatory cofactor NHE-RF1 isoform X1 [Hyla sarda]|uniref:Na(+)/H(+) exchange regulatory cofactor NHE-RF1 isoform X1 n=1 Tax=Hyla sarda TaxID=327740 RepID=UPI0024C2139B|nr:Na(+)/H(+) exchange regulatory cofactor NHE-RF1 isoform X1 [Hyla sarda]